MSFFTHHNLDNYKKHQAYYYAKYIKRLEPWIKRFPVIMKLSYVIQILIWFGIPIIVILATSPGARRMFNWKVMLWYLALFIPAGWGWNWYAAAYTDSWVFLPPLFTGIEIFGMAFGDFFFYIVGIPCFYMCYLWTVAQCEGITGASWWRRNQNILNYIWTAAMVVTGVLGFIFFIGAGKSIAIFMYGPVLLLVIFHFKKIPFPEVLIMTAIGMFLEFSWDKYATTYGFWVYQKNFIGVYIWGTVPIEMVFFSFPAGTSTVLVTRTIMKRLKLEQPDDPDKAPADTSE